MWKEIVCKELWKFPLSNFASRGDIAVSQRWVEFKTVATQPSFTFSKLTTETVEQGVKYVQS